MKKLVASLLGVVVLAAFLPIATAKADSNFPTSRTDFINQLYHCVLQRDPELAGAQFWLDQYNNNNLSAAQLDRIFYTSVEFQQKNLTSTQFVRSMYNCVYFREADQGGLSFWVYQMDVNHATQATILDAFLTSPEFPQVIEPQLHALPSTIAPAISLSAINSDRDFISSLYTCMIGRQPDQAGLDYWVGQFQNPGRQDPVREMYRAFFASQEFSMRNATNAAFVHDMYRCVYFRNVDSAGYTFWLGKMNYQGATQQQILQAFLTHPEFNQNILPKLQSLIKHQAASEPENLPENTPENIIVQPVPEPMTIITPELEPQPEPQVEVVQPRLDQQRQMRKGSL